MVHGLGTSILPSTNRHSRNRNDPGNVTIILGGAKLRPGQEPDVCIWASQTNTLGAATHLSSLVLGQRCGAAGLTLAVQAVVVALGPVGLRRQQVLPALASHLRDRRTQWR